MATARLLTFLAECDKSIVSSKGESHVFMGRRKDGSGVIALSLAGRMAETVTVVLGGSVGTATLGTFGFNRLNNGFTPSDLRTSFRQATMGDIVLTQPQLSTPKGGSVAISGKVNFVRIYDTWTPERAVGTVVFLKTQQNQWAAFIKVVRRDLSSVLRSTRTKTDTENDGLMLLYHPEGSVNVDHYVIDGLDMCWPDVAANLNFFDNQLFVKAANPAILMKDERDARSTTDALYPLVLAELNKDTFDRCISSAESDDVRRLIETTVSNSGGRKCSSYFGGGDRSNLIVSFDNKYFKFDSAIRMITERVQQRYPGE